MLFLKNTMVNAVDVATSANKLQVHKRGKERFLSAASPADVFWGMTVTGEGDETAVAKGAGGAIGGRVAAAAAGEEADLTEEERALLALGEIGKSGDEEGAIEETIDVSDEDILAELEGLDLDEDLLMEGGDEAAKSE